MTREWVCRNCANWYSDKHPIQQRRSEEPENEMGMCTLYPDHKEKAAGHWCGHYTHERVGHARVYNEGARVFSRERYHDETYADLWKEKREVNRLREVAKGLRRKLKEERAKANGKET